MYTTYSNTVYKISTIIRMFKSGLCNFYEGYKKKIPVYHTFLKEITSISCIYFLCLVKMFSIGKKLKVVKDLLPCLKMQLCFIYFE